MTNYVDLIVNNLWLGSEESALNNKFIREFDITNIVNISKDSPNKFINIKYLRIPVDNKPEYIDLFRSYLNYSYFFINTAISKNKNVLISSSNNLGLLVTIFYIMKKYKLTYNAARLKVITKIKNNNYEPFYLKASLIT